MRVSEKTTENSEQLGRQARPGIEPGASHQPVLAPNRSATGGAEKRGYEFYKLRISVVFENIVLLYVPSEDHVNQAFSKMINFKE